MLRPQYLKILAGEARLELASRHVLRGIFVVKKKQGARDSVPSISMSIKHYFGIKHECAG